MGLFFLIIRNKNRFEFWFLTSNKLFIGVILYKKLPPCKERQPFFYNLNFLLLNESKIFSVIYGDNINTSWNMRNIQCLTM